MVVHPFLRVIGFVGTSRAQTERFRHTLEYNPMAKVEELILREKNLLYIQKKGDFRMKIPSGGAVRYAVIVGEAMQGFTPPVDFFYAQAWYGGRLVPHQGCLLFQR